jgi:hypothetical protein
MNETAHTVVGFRIGSKFAIEQGVLVLQTVQRSEIRKEIGLNYESTINLFELNLRAVFSNKLFAIVSNKKLSLFDLV